MARSRIKIVSRTKRLPTRKVAKTEPVSIKAPRNDVSARQRPRGTLLLAAIFPIARVLYRWKECFGDQELSQFYKSYVTVVVSATSAAVAAAAVWWPLKFRKQVNIDIKWSRMGMLFCVFGLQLGQSIPWALLELYGRRLVILVLLVLSMMWQCVSTRFLIRETFLIGCFMCGAFVPAYQCIGYGTLVELFGGGTLNFVVGIYVVISILGIVISRPSPLVASGYLTTLLLTVSDTSAPLETGQDPIISMLSRLILRLEPFIIIVAIIMIIRAK